MHRFRLTIIFSVASFFVALVAIVVAGGGHGTTAPASWLFPWAFMESLWNDSELSETFALTAIFLQFPVYGFVYDLRQKKYIIVIIMVIHLLVASLVNNKRQGTHDTVGLHHVYGLICLQRSLLVSMKLLTPVQAGSQTVLNNLNRKISYKTNEVYKGNQSNASE